MRIACPYCGDRSLDEFAIHGDAAPVRPKARTATAADDFYAFAYERANKAGRSDEYWQHLGGCRAWLIVTRNTLTHEILAVTAARDLALDDNAVEPDDASDDAAPAPALSEIGDAP